MSTFLRDQLQAARLVRMKQRSRKAWADRQHGECNCAICQIQRAGSGVRVVSLTDIFGRDEDEAPTALTAAQLN